MIGMQFFETENKIKNKIKTRVNKQANKQGEKLQKKSGYKYSLFKNVLPRGNEIMFCKV
jgi:hypothetical protein